jgi:hypothetical protein
VGGDGRRAVVPALGLGLATVLLLAAAGAAGDEDEDGGDEGQNGGGQDAPGGGAVAGRDAVDAVPADPSADHAEEDKVADDGDGGEEEAQGGDAGGQQGDQDALAQGEQEGDEEEAAGDGVQDHDVGQGLGGALGGPGEPGALDVVHYDLGDVVADVGVAAPVTTRGKYVSKLRERQGDARTMNLRVAGEVIATADTPAKAAKVDVGVGIAGHVDAEHGQAIGSRGRDAGHDEESGCRQKEDRADVAEEATDTHDVQMWQRLVWLGVGWVRLGGGCWCWSWEM